MPIITLGIDIAKNLFVSHEIGRSGRYALAKPKMRAISCSPS